MGSYVSSINNNATFGELQVEIRKSGSVYVSIGGSGRSQFVKVVKNNLARIFANKKASDKSGYSFMCSENGDLHLAEAGEFQKELIRQLCPQLADLCSDTEKTS